MKVLELMERFKEEVEKGNEARAMNDGMHFEIILGLFALARKKGFSHAVSLDLFFTACKEYANETVIPEALKDFFLQNSSETGDSK